MKVIIAILAFTVGAYSQALTEHAAAAAGAAAGVMGGKVVSIGIDKVMGNAAKAGSVHAASVPKKATPEAPKPVLAAPPKASLPAAAPPEAAVSPAPAPVTVRSSWHTAARSTPQVPVVFTSPEEKPVDPPMRVLTAEDFGKIKVGEQREAVMAALGPASSAMTIPDEEHLIEILSYTGNGQLLGTVRIDNGQVVSVTTAQ